MSMAIEKIAHHWIVGIQFLIHRAGKIVGRHRDTIVVDRGATEKTLTRTPYNPNQCAEDSQKFSL
jgi:hypothetical protein